MTTPYDPDSLEEHIARDRHAPDTSGPVLEVVIYDGNERTRAALITQGIRITTLTRPGSPNIEPERRTIVTIATGTVLERTMDASSANERIETLRALGRAVRRYCPEAADALESWDGRPL